MPIEAYIGYGLYVVYTGVYVYIRTHGKSAQFITSRVFPDSAPSFKFLVDTGVGAMFFFGSAVILWKTVVQ